MQAARNPWDLDGLVSFWDFREEAGHDRVAMGRHAYRLREGAGPVARVDDGVFGPHSAFVEFGQWLHVPRATCRDWTSTGLARSPSWRG